MPRILLIEDEATLRNTMARGLSKLAGVEVAEAGTLGEGLAELDRKAPDLILSDIDLPDRPGIELIGEMGRRGLHCPVIFASAYVRAFAAQIPRFANVRVLEKPVRLEELREIVQSTLKQAQSSEEGPFGVVDFLQLACMGQHSVTITVGQEPSVVGRIIVYQGALWSSADGKGEGQAAFARLVLMRGLPVSVKALKTDPGVRSIHEPWEHLLLEVMRREDERAAGGPAVPAPAAPSATIEPPAPAVPPAPPAPTQEDIFQEALDRGVEALLHKDYRAAVEAFQQAAAIFPDDRTVQANLRRLRELGHVT